MKLHEVTGLGRPIDPASRSNRIALAGATLFGGLALFITWLQAGAPDLARAVGVGIGAFLAWAIARELDPDRPRTATLALVVGGIFALFAAPALIVSAVILLGARILAGTVGTDLRALDLMVVIGAAGVAGTRPSAWPAIAVLGYAVWRTRPARTSWVITAIAASAIGGALLAGAAVDLSAPGIGTVVLVSLGLAVGLARRSVDQVVSVCDSGVTLIDSDRVARARQATLIGIVGGSLVSPAGALALGPAVAAVLALAFHRRARSTQPGVRPSVDAVVATRQGVGAIPLGAGSIPPVL